MGSATGSLTRLYTEISWRSSHPKTRVGYFTPLLGDIYMRQARFTDARTGFEKALNSFYLYDIPERVYNRVAAEGALALAEAVVAHR